VGLQLASTRSGMRFRVGSGGFLGGKGCLCFSGGWPPGEGMAALCLVNLIGVRGGCWLAATVVVAFCFFC
jgi:hypothetical protein